MAKSAKYLPEYLSFTRKERIGIIAIAILILLFICLPFLFPFFIKHEIKDQTVFKEEIDRLNLKLDSSTETFKRNYQDDYDVQYAQPSDKHYNSKKFKGELFYFDPNSLSVDGWKKLGIKERTANTIQKYISKGGRFYKPEDIGKIWGLHKDEVNRLLPYVKIESKQTVNYLPAEIISKPLEKTKKNIATVDINKADTAAFIALPGIGSKLAVRIIAFREKLGGFYKIEQVGEIYGLPDSTFQKIKGKLIVTATGVKKLNINTASADELKAHPYLRYNIANAIVQYRTTHGSFSQLNDLKKIMIITEEIYNKVEPYFTLNE